MRERRRRFAALRSRRSTQRLIADLYAVDPSVLYSAVARFRSPVALMGGRYFAVVVS